MILSESEFEGAKTVVSFDKVFCNEAPNVIPPPKLNK
jgi:hypothetical protein